MGNLEKMPSANNANSNSQEDQQNNNNDHALYNENLDKSQEEAENKESEESVKSPDNFSKEDQEKIKQQ